MTDLKTLKEIAKIEDACELCGESKVKIIKLRQEAIKRAKYFLKKGKLTIVKVTRIEGDVVIEWAGFPTEQKAYFTGRVTEIVDFYELTEEDLK